MKILSRTLIFVALVMLTLSVSAAYATDFSFTGNFTNDNDVQFFNFSVGAPSTVTLETYSYAGGTNAAGQVIARGGFDPILALFDSTGALIGQNDDGGPGLVPADAVTGEYYDTYLSTLLNPGNYEVSIMQYNNFAYGPNLSDGFWQSGVANNNFTAQAGFEEPDSFGPGFFWDLTGNERDSHWAFDILNVNQAVEAQPVPEPTTMLLFGAGLAGVGIMRRRFQK